MPLYLVPNALGVFLHDEDHRIVGHALAYPYVSLGARLVRDILQGEISEEVANLFSQAIRRHTTTVAVESTQIARALKDIQGLDVVTTDSRNIKTFRNMVDRLLVEQGLIESPQALRHYRHRVALLVGQQVIADASQVPDLPVRHAIDAVDELDKSINMLAMHLREWFSAYHPLVSDKIEDNEHLAVIVSLWAQGKFSMDELTGAGIPTQLAQELTESFLPAVEGSLPANLAPMADLASAIRELADRRREIEKYISEAMVAVAPNITALVGPLIGARLISMAGSLMELARKPSSTIQILGAEKALFRSLRTGTAPPKHGVIFQVPLLRTAPYWQRGKIARALAAKLAIAARVDAFSGRSMGDSLRNDLERRVEEIRRQSPEPPPTRPQRRRQRDSGAQRTTKKRRRRRR
ncbi:MAG: NOP5/NOP56 family protein [Candidatus Thorarchaeota archaeon]